MQRILAIIEREMRRYMRSPALIFIALVLPLGQLIILGNSFGGKVQGVRLALVDEDHGPEARRVREALQSIESTAKTFQVVLYQTEQDAVARRALRPRQRRSHYPAGILAPGLLRKPASSGAFTR